MKRWAICLEQTLGHRAHGLSIERALEGAAAQVDVHRIDYPERQRVRVPWALRGSFEARRRLREHGPYALAFYHTQTLSLLADLPAPKTPYVVSMDATPAQFDSLGQWYGHRRWPRVAELGKQRWYRHVLCNAAALVAWSNWTADSLVDQYGVDRSRILVARPGASQDLFDIAPRNGRAKPRILFVGGEFNRKGGPGLVRAFDRVADRAELLLVTDADVPAAAGVLQRRGIRPGTAELREAYASADVFCLPTQGDCSPLVIAEAMAAGLPVISTPVGAIPETVRDGKTGILVPAGDDGALAEAMVRLVEDRGLRARMGAASREAARDSLNAARNAARIVTLLETVSS